MLYAQDQDEANNSRPNCNSMQVSQQRFHEHENTSSACYAGRMRRSETHRLGGFLRANVIQAMDPTTSSTCSAWGTSLLTMRCARPSTTAVLPTPGSPMRHGLFFVRRDRIWMDRRISSSRPITCDAHQRQSGAQANACKVFALRKVAYLQQACLTDKASWVL